MYTDEELLPVSALQHLLFCPRQCALIHLEQAWVENRHTADGRLAHDRAHRSEGESRPGVRVARGLRLCEYELGLSGIADVVEFHQADADAPADQTILLPGRAGRWTVYPVEYKRGRPKKNPCDRVQLCAQALCLEAMLHVHIVEGALFYGRQRRRHAVAFDDSLRRQTREAVRALRELFTSGITPTANYEKKCETCSLLNLCLPAGHSQPKSAGAYVQRMICQTLPSKGDDSNANP